MSAIVPAICATAAGVMAVGSLMSAHKATAARPSACSARRAPVEQPASVVATAEPSPELALGVSARRQTTSNDFVDELWNNMTEEGEAQFRGQGGPKLGANSKAVQDAKRELAPINLDVLNTKTIGATPLVGGRAMESAKRPPVTGFMFNMPEAYADQMQLQESDSA